MQCILCEFHTEGRPQFSQRSMRQHWTLRHSTPVMCVELTCANLRHEHNYGDSACSYRLDPVEGLIPNK
jgi:hypothetical protein